MRATPAIVAIYLALGGCATYDERQSLGYGDYVGFSCISLAKKVRLMERWRPQRDM